MALYTVAETVSGFWGGFMFDGLRLSTQGSSGVMAVIATAVTVRAPVRLRLLIVVLRTGTCHCRTAAPAWVTVVARFTAKIVHPSPAVRGDFHDGKRLRRLYEAWGLGLGLGLACCQRGPVVETLVAQEPGVSGHAATGAVVAHVPQVLTSSVCFTGGMVGARLARVAAHISGVCSRRESRGLRACGDAG